MFVVLVAYADARAVQKRLDDVLGPENWKDEYREIHTVFTNGKGAPVEVGGLLCRLSIRDIATGEWISKEDAADFRPEMGGERKQVKGGVSDALKRAAARFGIGRELYDIYPQYVWDVIQGWPPKGKKVVTINSNKPSFFGWCEIPDLSGNGNKRTPKKADNKTTKDDPPDEQADPNQVRAIQSLRNVIDFSNLPQLKNEVDAFLNSDYRPVETYNKLLRELNEAPQASKTQSIKNKLERSNV